MKGPSPEEVKQARHAAELTNRSMADLLGVTTSQVSGWQAPITAPSHRSMSYFTWVYFLHKSGLGHIDNF